MVRETALGTAASLLAARLNADLSDGAEPRLPCACGADARRSGRRSKTVTTALGPLTLERAWYHCGACGSGFGPRDRALRVEGRSLSPGALRMVGVTAAAITVALRERLEHERHRRGIEARTRELRAIAERCAKLMGPDSTAIDHGELLYDDLGLPK